VFELLAPVLVPLAGAALVFAVRGRTARFAVLLAATLGHMGATAAIWRTFPAVAASEFVRVDASGLLFLSVVSLMYCLVAVQLIAYTKNEPRGAPPVFLACHLFALAAMSLSTIASHWGLFWVAMEATTLASAPLVFYHHGPRSLEAVWKYLIVCSVGIALALLGTLFLGMAATRLASGTENPLVFTTLLAHAHELSTPWLRMAIVFLLVGYGTKMGLAPMHTWKPDAYGEAPPPVAALLSGGLTNCAFLAILRIAQLSNAAGEGPFLQPMLVVLGVLSLGVGVAAMIGQGNYRRMLAYSSVEHMGVLVLALGVGGMAAFGGLLHAVNNSMNKGILFLAAGNILQARRTSDVKDVTGLVKSQPATAALFFIGLLAATGFPPFGTFASEFTILRGIVADGRFVVAALYLAFLAIGFIGLASVVFRMVQGDPAAPHAGPPKRESLVSLLPIVVFMGIALVLGVHVPAPLEALVERAASDLSGAVR
jgi:hydrogenase-4 component F